MSQGREPTRNPVVSVIITTYNRGNLVCATVDSVLAQQYPNLEVIVVDDHSADDTEEVLAAYGDRIISVRHEGNCGVQIASMTGYAHSSGKYLCFVGDDDIWQDPTKVTKQVRVFQADENGRYGIVTSAVQEFGYPEASIRPKQWPQNLRAHLLRQNGIIYGSAAMLRASAFEQVGGFDKYLVKGTDSDVFRRIVFNGWDVYFEPEPLILYRRGHQQMTSRHDIVVLGGMIKNQIRILRKYKLLFARHPSAAVFRIRKLIFFTARYAIAYLRPHFANLLQSRKIV